MSRTIPHCFDQAEASPPRARPSPVWGALRLTLLPSSARDGPNVKRSLHHDKVPRDVKNDENAQRNDYVWIGFATYNQTVVAANQKAVWSVQVHHAEQDDGEIVVVTYPIVPHYPTILTETEREVVLEIMRGESNATIAHARRTSVNTVANQIAAIFGKLAVNSRAELTAKLHRACAKCLSRASVCGACPVQTG